MKKALATLLFAAAPGVFAQPAYYIAEIEVKDRAALRPYSEQVEKTFRAHGGEYVVRRGKTESLEGKTVDTDRGGIVIIRFPSMKDAQDWYHRSADYLKLRPIRHGAATTRAYIVEGLAVD